MRSYQLVDWGAPLKLNERATPAPEGTEVLVKVAACGVCHSDLHIQAGYFDLGPGNKRRLADHGAKLPMTLGHEVVGEVAALGPEAEGVAVGDKRIVFPWIGCRQCEVCARGDENLCNKPRFIGARVDGGYSDYVLVPHAKYLIDYAGIPTELAATYACAGITAYGALKKTAPLAAADHLLIIGAGGVGLTAISLAPAVTDARLIVADIDPTKRAAGLETGARTAIDNGAEGAVKQVIEMTGGGVAAAIDFVGRPATSRFGIDCLRKNGVHVIVGLYGDAMTIPVALFPLKQMTVRGSYVGTLTEMKELMAVVKAGTASSVPLTPRPLDEANQVLEDLSEGRVVGRVVLRP